MIQKIKKAKKKNAREDHCAIRQIVVHVTCTATAIGIPQLNTLPYHYVVGRDGKLIHVQPLRKEDTTIEIALLGGLDKQGGHTDTRTERQKEALFNALIVLSEHCPDAHIVGADELHEYEFPNPGFSVREFIRDYIPNFLLAA